MPSNRVITVGVAQLGPKAKYDAPLAAGKPPKVALTAIMRKLLILAHALLRDRRPWSPSPA